MLNLVQVITDEIESYLLVPVSSCAVAEEIYLFTFGEAIPVEVVFYLCEADTQTNVADSNPAIKRIYLYEDVWRRSKEVVIGRLMAALGRAEKVYGRSCNVQRIDKHLASDFLAIHHLQGSVSGKYRYGLFLREELLAVAVFSGSRKMAAISRDYRSYELIRSCNKQGMIVVGGLSKLIACFVTAFRPQDVMTYVDRDWSDGQSLNRLGFKYAGITPVQSYWVNRHTWFRCPTHRLPKEIKSLNDEEIGAKGYYALQNHGSYKMVRQYGAYNLTP